MDLTSVLWYHSLLCNQLIDFHIFRCCFFFFNSFEFTLAKWIILIFLKKSEVIISLEMDLNSGNQCELHGEAVAYSRALDNEVPHLDNAQWPRYI